MAKIKLKLNKSDLSRILQRGETLEKALMDSSGDVYSYLLVISNGYVEAVLSGIGQTTTGTLTLKSFLGETKQVQWKKLGDATLKLKKEKNWALAIWKASGKTEKAVKIHKVGNARFKSIFAGIDESTDREAYEHAVRTEFGAQSEPGGINYDGRALFTLLGAIFEQHTDSIVRAIEEEIRKTIEKTWRN